MTLPHETSALPASPEDLAAARPLERSVAWPPDAVVVPPLTHERSVRMEQAVARVLFKYSKAILAMWGASPVERHGRKLDSQLQLLLALRKRKGQVNLLQGDTPAKARVQTRLSSLRYAQADPAMASVREFHIPGPGGNLRVRHYVPKTHLPDTTQRLPLMVFYHGGGFSVCDLDTHDQPCRVLADRARVHVLSVDYRLAPEHPYPAPVEDARAAYAWAVENAGMLGADPGRVGVAGDSAGGNLATGTALWAISEGGRVPYAQFLIYPVVDSNWSRPSRTDLNRGFGLTQQDMEWSTQNYTGFDDALERDPYVVPLLAQTLSGMPRTVILTAGFDPLRDEGNDYAAALRAAGTEVVHLELEGMVHGFINMAGVSSSARRNLELGCDKLAELL